IAAHGLRALGGLADLRVAREAGLAVDAYAAGAADRGLAGAADADRAVLVVARLEDAVEHGALGRQVNREVLPIRRLPGLGVVAADLQRVIGHQYVRASGCHCVIVTSE